MIPKHTHTHTHEDLADSYTIYLKCTLVALLNFVRFINRLVIITNTHNYYRWFPAYWMRKQINDCLMSEFGTMLLIDGWHIFSSSRETLEDDFDLDNTLQSIAVSFQFVLKPTYCKY